MELQSKAAVRMGRSPNQTLKEFTSGPTCCQSLVQTCFFSMGAWYHLGNLGLVLSKWHSTHASLGLKTTTRITSYMNVCHPLSTMRTTVHPFYWVSENRPEQSVKHYPGKPVMTTSSSIWPSVGRRWLRNKQKQWVQKKKNISTTVGGGLLLPVLENPSIFFLPCIKLRNGKSKMHQFTV